MGLTDGIFCLVREHQFYTTFFQCIIGYIVFPAPDLVQYIGNMSLNVPLNYYISMLAHILRWSNRKYSPLQL